LGSACPSESESEAQDLLPPRLVVLEGFIPDSSGGCWVRPLGEPLGCSGSLERQCALSALLALPIEWMVRIFTGLERTEGKNLIRKIKFFEERNSRVFRRQIFAVKSLSSCLLSAFTDLAHASF